MNTEKLWKVLPFPKFDPKIDREEIHAENWIDCHDFLSNGSSGVTVAIVHGGKVGNINNGDLIVYDVDLPPALGDYIVDDEMRVSEYKEGKEAYGVVTCFISPFSAHKRQRQQKR